MKVTINRNVLFDYLKSMIRIVPQTHSQMELRGFLVECNEDDGFMYITASNIETSIKRKFKANIEEGGSFVVSARMFLNITDRMSGDNIILEYNGKLLGIKSGNCRYDIPVIEARNYPQINIPYPDSLLKISGICGLYSKTSAAVSSDDTKPALTGIHLNIYSDTVQAASCDIHRLAVTENKCECGGKLSVTIPKQSFFYLASAVEYKDELQIGISDGKVVFVKPDMLFSTRIIYEPFLDISRLLEAKDKKLVARVKADDMQTMIETVSMIANFGEDVAPVTMKFNENSIHISVESTEASTEVDVPAEITDGAGREFYYNAKHFTDMAKVIKTEADIHLTNGGILYVSNGLSEYMLVNTRKREVKRKVKKTVSKAKKAA